ncbi:hypothetical protein N8I74_09465 [Chitiniphilus purpureus]|uniref:Uncharacterized protein n=1 Tax=Chitiniphilus purpureus TaxID=2981137 RepID=A0ABY6DS60_9NEIS|nr:hypothetical protein [Chitiniphilus sp. CD1]UXY17215.1 hypothetical protein N8I74_09465 [Chitiniphilus sp. CD1]
MTLQLGFGTAVAQTHSWQSTVDTAKGVVGGQATFVRMLDTHSWGRSHDRVPGLLAQGGGRSVGSQLAGQAWPAHLGALHRLMRAAR